MASVSIGSSEVHCKAVLQGFGSFGLGATPNSSLPANAFATSATPASSTFPQPQLSATAAPSASSASLDLRRGSPPLPSPFPQVQQGGLSSLSTTWSSPAPAPAVISTSSGFGQSAALGFGVHTPSARFLARLIVRLRFDSYTAMHYGSVTSGQALDSARLSPALLVSPFGGTAVNAPWRGSSQPQAFASFGGSGFSGFGSAQTTFGTQPTQPVGLGFPAQSAAPVGFSFPAAPQIPSQTECTPSRSGHLLLPFSRAPNRRKAEIKSIGPKLSLPIPSAALCRRPFWPPLRRLRLRL